MLVSTEQVRLAVQALGDRIRENETGYFRVGYDQALEDLEAIVEEWEEE